MSKRLEDLLKKRDTLNAQIQKARARQRKKKTIKAERPTRKSRLLARDKPPLHPTNKPEITPETMMFKGLFPRYLELFAVCNRL